MSIFNSLGSNYNFRFVLGKFISENGKKFQSKLVNLLEEKYGGKAILTYKGREAIRLALETNNLKGTTVGICGFTCFAVWEAVKKEGYNIEYLDIDKESLHFSAETVKKAIEKNHTIKTIIIQNTLGYPCDIENISRICREKNIILIEDLAHSIGATYKSGKEAGTVGDFVILSFSQDKMIDNVSGGALIVRDQGSGIRNQEYANMDLGQKLKDKMYPLITFKIRKTYSIGIGRVIHRIAKLTNILSNPMLYSDYENVHTLPVEYCKNIYLQFLIFEKNLEHRRKIAHIYKSTLNKQLISENITNSLIDVSSNIRFPIFTEDRKSLINFLKKSKIYVSDIWYDAPISPKKYLNKTDYKTGSCPSSEFVSERILNLPTHINVNESTARYIAEKINIWMKSK